MREAHNSTHGYETPTLSNAERGADGQDRPRDYLTVAELCDELSISLRNAYYRLSMGEIPSVRVGRSIRIYRAALDEWRRKQEAESRKKGPLPAKVEASDPRKGSHHGIV